MEVSNENDDELSTAANQVVQLPLSAITAPEDDTQKNLEDTGGEDEEDEQQEVGEVPTPDLHENNAYTDMLHGWHQNGNKAVRWEKTTDRYPKLYYVCANKGCNAKKTVHFGPKVVSTYSGVHNHLPEPSGKKRSRSTETPEQQKKRPIVNGSSNASSISSSILSATSSAPINSQNSDTHDFYDNSNSLHNSAHTLIPSLQQFYNWKYSSNSRKAILGPENPMAEVITRYENIFLQKVEIFPTLHYIFAGQFGISLLEDHGKQLFVDTFEICGGRTVVTTVIVLVDGLALPAAWSVSNSRTENVYEDFFMLLKRQTRGLLDPECIIVDFESSLRSGISTVFPYAVIVGDWSQFSEAHSKWLDRNSFSNYKEVILPSIQSLYESKTKEEFSEKKNQFLQHWRELLPEYAEYFEREWLKHFPPRSWALHDIAARYPTTTNTIRMHKNRLEKLNFPQTTDPVDQIAAILWSEEEYFSSLWLSKKQE